MPRVVDLKRCGIYFLDLLPVALGAHTVEKVSIQQTVDPIDTQEQVEHLL